MVLLAAYHYAFGFSLAIGLGIVATLLLALPFFLRSALRFRLHNTQYRGLHFDFSGSTAGAYRGASGKARGRRSKAGWWRRPS